MSSQQHSCHANKKIETTCYLMSAKMALPLQLVDHQSETERPVDWSIESGTRSLGTRFEF